MTGSNQPQAPHEEQHRQSPSSNQPPAPHEELIKLFCEAAVGATVASQYLERNNGDLNQAVRCFIDESLPQIVRGSNQQRFSGDETSKLMQDFSRRSPSQFQNFSSSSSAIEVDTTGGKPSGHEAALSQVKVQDTQDDAIGVLCMEQEGIATYLVAKTVKALENCLEDTNVVEADKKTYTKLIKCFSEFYTLAEMVAELTSTTSLTESVVEALYRSLFTGDASGELGLYDAYVAHSNRMEACRRKDVTKAATESSAVKEVEQKELKKLEAMEAAMKEILKSQKEMQKDLANINLIDQKDEERTNEIHRQLQNQLVMKINKLEERFTASLNKLSSSQKEIEQSIVRALDKEGKTVEGRISSHLQKVQTTVQDAVKQYSQLSVVQKTFQKELKEEFKNILEMEQKIIKAIDLKKIATGKDDPGYLNTAPVRSSISYIDGGEGILRYRGYPIEEMAERSTFLEVAYLLMYGNLPTESQLSDWKFEVSQNSTVPQGVLDIIQAMPHDAHPMEVLVSAMSALSIFHPDANPALRGQDIYNSKQVRDKQIVRIIGKAPTIAAAAYLRMSGRPPVLPSGNLSYAENFLYMLDSTGNISYKPNPRLARVLDILFILHAEKEMNCSTAAARHLASSGVDVYTVVSGAVGTLYDPLHGGANEAVLKMLEEIGTVKKIPDFIEGVKNRKRKMSGFGHRVYKNNDPRARVIKKLADEVFSILGRDPLIEIAVALEKAALSDDYFVKRKLYPNVDFYSGLIYRAMGFPPEFFTVLFAIPRMAGYLSHWKESLDDPDTKIMRPQQVYTGEWLRHYTPVRERKVTDDESKNKLGQVSTSNASRRRLAGSSVEA